MDFHGLQLDAFQEQAIGSIEQGHSVLVGAPTGTGKTLIAEYAVERSLERGEHVIYTAPIKALSNQKFHDFHARYGERVGILTGDVSINSGADLVVMTTEILRNTMLEDPERLQSVAYVVFDEIHYVHDVERGTVWEESIILCPPHIAFVCLSATAPNIEQFAAWIRSVHPIAVDVVVEARRAVPIETAFFAEPIGLCDFHTLQRAAAVLKTRHYNWELFARDWAERSGHSVPHHPRGRLPSRRRGQRASKEEIHHSTLRILDYLADNERLPCLFFSPMRRLCEVRATYLAQHHGLSAREELRVLERFDALCSMQGLGDEPAVQSLRELVRSGVAYHHAGLLPALKQVVERLFAMGLLRALFATETFAVGVNMPARSVVFDGIEKFDGHAMRPLMAREFQQMSGRAGRRGIDERGYVYVQIDLGEFQPTATEHAAFGRTESIDSQFDLGYSSILNLYEQFGEQMYQIARKSFAHYQASGAGHAKSGAAADLGEGDRPCPCGRPGLYASFTEMKQRLAHARQEVAAAARTLRKGARAAQDLATQLNAARAYYEELQEDFADFECRRCPESRACAKAAHATQKRRKAARRFEGVRGDLMDRTSLGVHRRFAFLKELGYVSEEGLTSKGRIAKHIFGYELPVTELFFDGFFEKLDEMNMNALAAAIVFESKKADWYRESHGMSPLLGRAKREADALVRREHLLGLPSAIKPLDLNLTAAVRAWTEGATFQGLSHYTSASDGDLVRAFRLMLDLYRQIKRAMPEHRALVEKINRAIDRIKRPPVDPEWELMHAEEGPAE